MNIEKIKLLPLWNLNNTYPAFYDIDSKTTVEQTARVYGAMRELQETYNKFATQVNETIKAFISDVDADQDCFKESIIKLCNDYIKTMDMKIACQDKKVNDAIKYMKDNLSETIVAVVKEMEDNGELNEVILNAFNNMTTKIESLETLLNGEIQKIVSLQEDNEQNKENISSLNTNVANLHIENVVTMKETNSLKPGDVVQTLGYYNANDGGAGLYRIRELTDSDIDDGIKTHILLNGFVAEKISGFFKDYEVEEDAINYSSNIIRNGKAIIKDHTYGNYENGCVLSVRANNNNSKIPITGEETSYLAKNYHSRDSVGFFVDNTIKSFLYKLSQENIEEITTKSIKFNIDLINIKEGMFVDINNPNDENHYLGKIVSFSGNTLIVDGWFNKEGIESNPIISEITNIYINLITKIWGSNIICRTNEGEENNNMVGIELELRNYKGEDLKNNRGIDIVSNSFQNTVGILVRGTNLKGLFGWVYGFMARHSKNGFVGEDNGEKDFYSNSKNSQMGFFSSYGENKKHYAYTDKKGVERYINENGINEGFIRGNNVQKGNSNFNHTFSNTRILEYFVTGERTINIKCEDRIVGQKVKFNIFGATQTLIFTDSNGVDIDLYFNDGTNTHTKNPASITATKGSGFGIIELTVMPDNIIAVDSKNITINAMS